MLKYIFLFSFAFIFTCCHNNKITEINLLKDTAYPRWLKSGDYFPEQTSGICFIGKDENNIATFLLADDIGKVHHFKITSDTVFRFTPVYFYPQVEAYLDSFPKQDFEEISYNKKEGTVYLSIEGNNPNFRNYVGIYMLKFKDNNVFLDTITSIKKLNIKPTVEFLKYTANNIGYEGLAVDDNYLYLGLEGIVDSGVFADSTLLYIVDKKNFTIVKKISTKRYGIQTISGLYSDMDKSIYGVDRNNKKLFHLQFDASLNIKSNEIVSIPTSIPNFPSFNYVAALESITMDENGNIYLVDDPWKKYYIPSGEVLSDLDAQTIANFKKFIPIIYKFKIKNLKEN